LLYVLKVEQFCLGGFYVAPIPAIFAVFAVDPVAAV